MRVGGYRSVAYKIVTIGDNKRKIELSATKDSIIVQGSMFSAIMKTYHWIDKLINERRCANYVY